MDQPRDHLFVSPQAQKLQPEKLEPQNPRLSALSALMTSLDEACHSDPLTGPRVEDAYQEQLAAARLGVASGLFAALRAKHPPTAAHCLRVALGVSSWAMQMSLPDAQRDELEVGALMHDIGKIGVPDYVLLNPGKLSGEELLLMERHRKIGRDVLSACCQVPAILEAVTYAPAWYDGSRHGFDRHGEQLPLGSRMIAIVDAFDAMTTDHLYRRALPRERAMAELYACSGTQFDPLLVASFCQNLVADHAHFDARVCRRWIRQLRPEQANGFWSVQEAGDREGDQAVGSAFHQQLLGSMHDGVIFVDLELKILLWNRAAERLTGLSAVGLLQQPWSPSLVRMRDEQNKAISDRDCPVRLTIQSGVQSLRRLHVQGRGESSISLDVHVSPVLGPDGVIRGASVLLHDASPQISLEERVQTLHEKATRDQLTKVSNRAEFDRVLPRFVETHLERGVPCSMVICDIDHFKKINDTHGHQAGDQALVAFAALLQRNARSGDLVARYGGEEFVILYADCDNAAATRRAEELRRKVAEQPQPALGDTCLTASFGVTEIQAGDTPETFLRRADRALLAAKDEGRNLVVQLGTGIGSERSWSHFRWLAWLYNPPGEQLLEQYLVTVVPLKVAAEKLRGFAADHSAEVVVLDDHRVALKISGQHSQFMRRWSDRPVPFMIELTLHERAVPNTDRRPLGSVRTIIQVAIRPQRARDRRRRDAHERARQLLLSLKAYLMAADYTEADRRELEGERREGLFRTARDVLTQWLRK